MRISGETDHEIVIRPAWMSASAERVPATERREALDLPPPHVHSSPVRAVVAQAFALGFGLCAVAACDEHFPVRLTGETVDAGAAIPSAPLEPSPPAIVAPDKRANASSSPVVFDPLRGGVWTANGDVGTVSYVDVEARRVVRETAAVGSDLRSVALSPDGSWLGAVDRAGGAVALIDAETGELRRSVPVGGHPRACVWDSANPRWLYVSIEDDAEIAVVDRTLGRVVATIAVGRIPSGVAVAGGRREMYVAHRIDADLTIVDLHERAVAAEVPLADEPFSDGATPNGKPFGFESMAITPDGTHAWIPHELLAPTHPLVFNQTLFPAISVVDLVGRAEQQTDPTAVNVVAGRKNLFDAIANIDSDGQPAVVSQICAVAIHPGGAVAWAVACGSEDLIVFDVAHGGSTDLLRSPGGVGCDHPMGLTLDDTGQRAFVLCDQSHTLLTLDTGGGDLVKHTRLYGDPIPLVATDPVMSADPMLRAGLTLFYRANSAKKPATTKSHWMACGGCHLDGFTSTNVRLFESIVAHDPQADARVGHVGLVDNFSTTPSFAIPCTPGRAAGICFNSHDVLGALVDQGAQLDPDAPSAEATQMAAQLARVIARDLPRAPSWLRTTSPLNTAWDAAFCGNCHKAEYEAWTHSVHAHAAEDPMVLHGADVERAQAGAQYSSLCVGCHDPVDARSGVVSLAPRKGGSGGVSCLGCHDVDRVRRAGGNGDLEASGHDWAVDHKAWGLASLDTLRQPDFCGGCHQQFVPGTGLSAIDTLAEYHASPYEGGSRCVECHMQKNEQGVADHRFPGGNVYMGRQFGDPLLVREQMASLSKAVTLDAKRVAGGVLVTVRNTGSGHAFPTGVTDIREPWVELQAKDANGHLLARIGGPSTDSDLLPPGAARLGIDIATPSGTVLLQHELSEASRIPFDIRVPAGEAQALLVALPSSLPKDAVSLDAVLYFRNVRTAYFRAAAAAYPSAGDAAGAAPTIEVARTVVPSP